MGFLELINIFLKPKAKKPDAHRFIISDEGQKEIERSEGCFLKAYQDIVGVWTIGFGSTCYPDGSLVKKGDIITEEEAEQMLRYNLDKTAKKLSEVIKVDCTQNQVDAIHSFVYNIGFNAFKNSTFLKLLNQGEYDRAASEFGRWVYAGGRKIRGLKLRRKREKELFLA